MPRYALRIEYRGDSFAGWQIQPEGARTVQGSLSDALFTLKVGQYRRITQHDITTLRYTHMLDP